MRILQTTVVIFSLLCAFSGSGLAERPEFPNTPKGFEWQWCEDASVGVLAPTDWHFKKVDKDETKAFFVTKEKIDPEKGFTTGLTFNLITDIKTKTGTQVSDYAKAFIRKAISNEKNVLLLVIPPGAAGPAKTFGCRLKRDDIIMHYFLVADDGNDKLYFFLFEVPKNTWESEWKTGEQMFKNLYIEFPK